jgi:hypothetical protein
MSAMGIYRHSTIFRAEIERLIFRREVAKAEKPARRYTPTR